MTDLNKLRETIEDWPNMFSDGKTNFIPVRDVLDLIDGAVEKEPCDDVVSRQAVLDTEYQIKEINGIEYVMLSEVQMKIRKMPSVRPQEPQERSET